MASETAADAEAEAVGRGRGGTTAGTLIPFLGLRGLLEVSLLVLTWSGQRSLLMTESRSALPWPCTAGTGDGKPGGFLTGVVTGGDVGTAASP